MLLVEDVLSACNNRTRLVSIMLANNETGKVVALLTALSHTADQG